MKKHLLVLSALAIAFGAYAKLPAPSEEAKAKAAEAAAKAAHGNKVADFQLCKSREKVAAHYFKTEGKSKAVPVATPACADPGAYSPTVTAAPAPAAPVAQPSAAPAAAQPNAAPAKKG